MARKQSSVFLEKNAGTIALEEEGSTGPVLRLAGDWAMAIPTDAASWFQDRRDRLLGRRLRLDATGLVRWNGRLVAFLLRLRQLLRANGGEVEWEGLPPGLVALLSLAKDGHGPAAAGGERRGDGMGGLAFLGELARCLFRLFRGRLSPRGTGWGDIIHGVGVEGLPIVALISLLSGVILGFVGMVQLARFGAAIYVADLVGLAMVREMAPLMTGIILAGRTAASFAATIGTMRCHGEVDALRTFAVDPVEFLVLPRLLSAALMAPPLEIFSAFIGIGGGMAVCLPFFDFSAAQYIQEMVSAVTFSDFLLGVAKSLAFGLLVGGYGCLRGLQCDRTAAGVGRGTTAAVVSSITAIVVADALFAVFCHRFRI
ncbi:MAG: ABC transporter permease [Puniceicoccales bacterium]|nr:ABC transporter permease [Puniceicoccales bacterium]